MAVPLINITATTTTTITTYAIVATATVLVVPDFTDSSRTVTQPIAGPSFPSRTFYSAHPVTHAENRTPPPANSGAPACPVPREGKGKRGTQAAKGGDHGSGGGSSTTAATADSLVIMTPILSTHSLLLLLLSLIQAAQLAAQLS